MTTSRHVFGSTSGTVSASQIVGGRPPRPERRPGLVGAGEAATGARQPGEPPVTASAPAYSAARRRHQPARRRTVRRDRSRRRGTTRRATTCQPASGISTRARATWDHMVGRLPTDRSRPVLCATPVRIVVAVSVASSTDAHLSARARRRPARITRLFAGTSATTSVAMTPWAMTTIRPWGVPVACATTPVANVTRSAASSARLVTRDGSGRRRWDCCMRTSVLRGDRMEPLYGRRPSSGKTTPPPVGDREAAGAAPARPRPSPHGVSGEPAEDQRPCSAPTHGCRVREQARRGEACGLTVLRLTWEAAPCEIVRELWARACSRQLWRSCRWAPRPRPRHRATPVEASELPRVPSASLSAFTRSTR